MEDLSSDKAVPREMRALLTGERLKLRETERAVTPFGGLAVFVEYLNRVDLIGELRRFYDLILIDCPPGDRWLTDSAFDSSEVSLLIGLPTDESARAAVPWSDMSWRYGLDARFGLIVNRVTAAGSIPQLLPAAFANAAVIPEDASHGNALELPWVVRPDSRAGRTLSEIAGRLVPDLDSKDETNAA